MTKPFSPRELVARIGGRAAPRSETAPEAASSTQSGVFRCGDVVLDNARRVVTRNGEELPINPKEYAILELLMKARARLSRATAFST
jgi:DNA-binding response OmpR family regulator